MITTLFTDRPLALTRCRYESVRGQTNLELALIMSFIALVVVGSVSLVGPKLLSIFQRVGNNL